MKANFSINDIIHIQVVSRLSDLLFCALPDRVGSSRTDAGGRPRDDGSSEFVPRHGESCFSIDPVPIRERTALNVGNVFEQEICANSWVLDRTDCLPEENAIRFRNKLLPGYHMNTIARCVTVERSPR
jgi:hypothetical protein